MSVRSARHMGATGNPAAAVAPVGLRGANVRPALRAQTGGRLGAGRLVGAFGLGFGVIVGVAVAIVALVAKSTGPLCQPYRPCGPIKFPSPLFNQTVWRSTQFGFTLEYPGDEFQVAQSDGARITLAEPLPDGSDAAIAVRGQPASAGSPAQAITAELARINGIGQLTADPNAADQVLSAAIGYNAGVGGAYVGTLNSPQGTSEQVGIGAAAATRGNVTIVVLVISPQTGGDSPDSGPKSRPWRRADRIMNSVQWPT